MRIVDIRERSVPISRYRDPSTAPGVLTTSIVAAITDVVREGIPVVGYGFSSIGRFAQSGLIRERFAPRLLHAGEAGVADDARENIDPFRCWNVMMKDEKPGGHGERSVAVGTLDMAIWDAAAKIANAPLHRFLARTTQNDGARVDSVSVYGGGGYYYPNDDLKRLQDEMREFAAGGYADVKIKVGGASLEADRSRIEAALGILSGGRLAVDAMNAYDPQRSISASEAFAPYALRWFEDVCDPLDFDTQTRVRAVYPGAIAAGEALFSLAEAKLLERYGGLDPVRDILLFDPAHCYGLPEYLRIVAFFETAGWKRTAFWPHGGHLFSLHVAAALGLGGAEVNPFCFQPFGGLADGVAPRGGRTAPPEPPGIGFESKRSLFELFRSLHA